LWEEAFTILNRGVRPQETCRSSDRKNKKGGSEVQGLVGLAQMRAAHLTERESKARYASKIWIIVGGLLVRGTGWFETEGHLKNKKKKKKGGKGGEKRREIYCVEKNFTKKKKKKKSTSRRKKISFQGANGGAENCGQEKGIAGKKNSKKKKSNTRHYEESCSLKVKALNDKN